MEIQKNVPESSDWDKLIDLLNEVSAKIVKFILSRRSKNQLLSTGDAFNKSPQEQGSEEFDEINYIFLRETDEEEAEFKAYLDKISSLESSLKLEIAPSLSTVQRPLGQGKFETERKGKGGKKNKQTKKRNI